MNESSCVCERERQRKRESKNEKPCRLLNLSKYSMIMSTHLTDLLTVVCQVHSYAYRYTFNLLTSLTKHRWNKKDHNSKTEDTGRRIPLESLTFKPTRFHFPPVYVKAQEHLFHFPCVGAGEVARKKSPTWLRAESNSPNTCTKAFCAPPKIAQACLSAGSLRLTEVSGIYS